MKKAHKLTIIILSFTIASIVIPMRMNAATSATSTASATLLPAKETIVSPEEELPIYNEEQSIQNNNNLPQTNEESYFIIIIIGLAMLLLAAKIQNTKEKKS